MSWGRIEFAAGMLALTLVSGMAHAQSSAADYTYATRYDTEGRVVGTIDPDPDGSGAIKFAAVRNTFDASGRLTRVEAGELSSWQSESVDPAAWTGFTVHQRVDTDYDVMGRKTVVRISAGGTTYSVTQYSYDSFGRLECTAIRMNPSIWTSLPSSACTPGTTGSGGPDRITRNVYDAAGQLLQVRKGVGTSVESAEVTYSYTANGKRQEVVDARGGRAKFVYDGYDRQVQWIFPSATAATSFNDATPATALSTANALNTSDYEQYGYDANGNLTSARKRDGRTLTFQYDALNRMTAKLVPDGGGLPSSATRDVYYSYDLRGLQTAARFDSASGADAVVNQYDGFGNNTSTTRSWSGVSWVVTRQFDANGNRTGLTQAGSLNTSYEYDGLDRLIAIRDANGVLLESFAYNTQGARSGQTSGATSTYGSGGTTTTTRAYDSVGRITSLTQDLASTGGDVSSTFAYNPANQIVNQTRSNDSYAFGGSINLGRAYSTNGLNQYWAAGPASFCYDANGNLTYDGSSVFLYDVENRLIAKRAATSSACPVTGYSGTLQASLAYDPLGRLIETSAPGTAMTRYNYDGDELSTEFAYTSGSLTGTTFYVHGDGADDPLMSHTAGAWRWLHANQQGSIVSVTDASGAVVNINAYDEYGIPNSGNASRFQYTGQTWLPEIGMYYYKARIYSPTLGRFLQADPVGYDDQFNLYAYVGNDPVNAADADGTTTGSHIDDGKALATGVSGYTTAEQISVDVWIWRPTAEGERQSYRGHVMITQGEGDDRRVILNIWPDKDGRAVDVNDFRGTIAKMGGYDPKKDLYTLTRSRVWYDRSLDGGVQNAARLERTTPRWFAAAPRVTWSPSTNCTESARRVLAAAGVRLSRDFPYSTPASLYGDIQRLPKRSQRRP